MAWIKMRHDLPDDPAVIAMAAMLEISEDCIIGKLLRFWSWADTQTVDGNASGVTTSWLDRYVGVTGFSKSMIEVGWLDASNGGLTVPKFDTHISQSAKQRAVTARRVAKYRAENSNASTVTKKLPEKRREEKKKKKPLTPYDPKAAELPAELATDAFRTAWADWCGYRREDKKKPLTPRMVKMQLKEMDEMGAPRAVEAIEYTIGRGWQGLQQPDSPKAEAKYVSKIPTAEDLKNYSPQ